MAMTFGSTIPRVGASRVRFSKDVSDLSQGRFTIEFFEPGVLVPALECFDPVSKGAIESCRTTPGYHAGRIPAVQFFTKVPFGPEIGELLAWRIFGGVTRSGTGSMQGTA